MPTNGGLDVVRLRALRSRRTLIAILGAAFVIRAVLVLQGGQFYWPDEHRYSKSRNAVEQLERGQVAAAVETLVSPEHVLFPVIGLLPAALELLHGASGRIPGLFFSLFAVAGIWAVWRIARLLDASEGEACFAAFLVACASTWSYYSRHLLPYDAAMAIGLLAMVVALRDPERKRDSWLCGLLSAATFLTYAGYWILSALVVVVRIVWNRRRPMDAIAHGARVVGGGLVLPLVVLAAGAGFGRSLSQEAVSFSGTVIQGRFSEGWSLPFAYLWHAEHLLAVVWLVAVIGAVVEVVRSGGRPSFALAATLFVYALLVVASVGFHVFVVYGRLARQLVPFLCLVTAQQIYRLRVADRLPVRAFAMLTLAIALQGAWNLAQPLSQVFPDAFRKEAAALTAGLQPQQFQLLYAGHIYPRPEPAPMRNYRVLARARHPLQYLPYQYEGYTPEERAELRSTDISMRVAVWIDE